MNKKFKFIHLIVLIIILFSGIATFISLAPNRQLQFIVGIATSVAYVLWGILHHSISGDLHKKIVVEYILISSIAVLLLCIVFFD